MSGPKRSDIIARLNVAEEWIRQQMQVYDQCRSAVVGQEAVRVLVKRMAESKKVMASEPDQESRKSFAKAEKLYGQFQQKEKEASDLRGKMEEVMRQVSKKVASLRQTASGGYAQDNEARRLQEQAQQGLEDYRQAYKLSLEALDLSRKANSQLTMAVEKQKEAAARRAAEELLASALEEAKQLDLAKAEKWAHQGQAAEQAQKQLEAVRALIEGKKYQEAERQIESCLKTVREIQETVNDNLAKAYRQRSKAKAIRDALLALKYRKPECYFEADEKGREDDVLRTLVIYAEAHGVHAPSITFRLGLNDDKLRWEFVRVDQNGHQLPLTEEDEYACKEQSMAIQKQLEAHGFDTPNADYGMGKTRPATSGGQTMVSETEPEPVREGSL